MARKPDRLTRWWRRISLRAKATGVTVAVLTLGLLLAGLGTAPILRSSLIANIDNQLPAITATNLAQRWFTITQTNGSLTFQPAQSAPRLAEYYFAIYGADGKFLASAGGTGTGEAPLFPTTFTLELAQTLSESPPFSLMGTAEGEFHAMAIVDEAQDVPYVQVVAISLEEAEAVVNTFFVVYTTVAFITVLLAALLIRGLITLTFRRLAQVESTAMSIAAGNFSQRLSDLEPTTEVGRLNTAINTMLDRVDQSLGQRDRSVQQMRRFVGDASHELRTPLVSVRGYAELYRMGAIRGDDDTARAMERIEKEAIRMGVLVEDLLALARLDEKPELQITTLDLRPIARDAALDLQAAAPGRQVSVIDRTLEDTSTRPLPTIAADAPGSDSGSDPGSGSGSGSGDKGAPTRTLATLALLRRRNRRDAERSGTDEQTGMDFRTPEDIAVATPPIALGEENKVRQVVANLLGNARRFSPDDSPIELVLDADRYRGTARISIVDHGEGIPEQVREQIFERFWRADTSRARETGGSGLGLAIVSSIVSALGGTVHAEETPGGGATFVVALPLAPTADGTRT